MKQLKAKELVKLSLLTAILFISQVSLAGIPNVELVSLLVIIYTLAYRKKVFYIIYAFTLLEGLLYGFGIWWFTYLYIWSILAGVTLLAYKNTSVFLWSIISGMFGLFFGLFCTIPYFIAGRWAFGVSYFIAGIPYDILHGVSNALVCFVLFQPLSKLLFRLNDP